MLSRGLTLSEIRSLAPRARFELATLRLTAECSTIELPGNGKLDLQFTARCTSVPLRSTSLGSTNQRHADRNLVNVLHVGGHRESCAGL